MWISQNPWLLNVGTLLWENHIKFSSQSYSKWSCGCHFGCPLYIFWNICKTFMKSHFSHLTEGVWNTRPWQMSMKINDSIFRVIVCNGQGMRCSEGFPFHFVWFTNDTVFKSEIIFFLFAPSHMCSRKISTHRELSVVTVCNLKRRFSDTNLCV